MKVKVISLLLVLLAIIQPFYIVDEAHNALVIQLGEVKHTRGAGLHMRIPFIQRIEKIDRRILDLSSDSKEVIALDQKRLIVDSYTKYRIDDPERFYKAVRTEYQLRSRLTSIVESNIREQIGRVPLIYLLTEARSSVMDLIHNGVRKQAEEFGIEVIDVRFKRTDLPEENSIGIFRRMNTDREKEAKEIRAQGAEEAEKLRAEADKETKLLLATARRKAQITKGRGEAKAAQILNEVMSKDRGFFEFYRYMQVYKTTLGKNNTKIILSDQSKFLKYLELGEVK